MNSTAINTGVQILTGSRQIEAVATGGRKSLQFNFTGDQALLRLT
jgi:hypothetical protein